VRTAEWEVYTYSPNDIPITRTTRLTTTAVFPAAMLEPDVILRTTLPETLRKVRRMRNISQAELARRSGVSCSTICEIESGQAADIRVRTLCKLCGVLSVSLDYLAGIIADETYASEAPNSADRPTVRESRTCPHCGKLLRRGEPHPPGECIIAADRRGGSTREHREFLAPVFGLSVAAIAFICDEH
jgi:transcriptional regulator with XRE-family HTH domain